MIKYDLTFPKLLIGTHGTPWDLETFLYVGAAGIERKLVIEAINKGDFGPVDMDRLPLISAFHEVLTTFIVKGQSQKTIYSTLQNLREVYTWADSNSLPLTKNSIINTFCLWTEHLLDRAYVRKEISPLTAYKTGTRVSNIIARALEMPGPKPGKNILVLTRMRRPSHEKEVLDIAVDKQNTSELFEFGNILTSICNALDVKTVRGELPIRIHVNDEILVTVVGQLHQPDLDLSTITDEVHLRSVVKSRQAMPDDEHLLDKHKRSSILKLRVECELLIFIAQTGINISQATKIEKSKYRWQTNGEDFDVFKVYKDRRHGEAIFRCYKGYREHFNRYLTWLDDAELSDFDDRLFPFFSRSIVPPKNAIRRFTATQGLFKKINKPFFGPQALRNNRVNWLLRQSQDIQLTAEQMAHSKEVLLRNYEKPHYESIVSEIIQYHNEVEIVHLSPGPGVCINEYQPNPIIDFLASSPDPDCISSDGCLFCDKHRDIMNFDYCLKLTSHAFLKELEISSYNNSENREVHPSYRVLDRILLKLKAISEENEVQARWVEEANDSIRAGRYHPIWDGHIKLLEVLI